MGLAHIFFIVWYDHLLISKTIYFYYDLNEGNLRDNGTRGGEDKLELGQSVVKRNC